MLRDHDGILIVDKPPNRSSAKVIADVKKITQAKKAGHTGTLDPFATGVMICCLNRATRLARFFLHGEKTYQAVLVLGKDTDTQDATGQTTAVCSRLNLTEADIRTAFQTFRGLIEQAPPVYSALKHNGTPLYKLARKGKPVQKPPRRVQIHQLEILEIDLPEVRFEVTCSAGTYIRTLCNDIGKKLGCGGHLKALRRTRSSGFTLKDALSLKELETLALSEKLSDKLIDMSAALPNLQTYTAEEALSRKILYGRRIQQSDLHGGPGVLQDNQASGAYVKVVDLRGNLLAVLETPQSDTAYTYCCVFNTSEA